MAQPENDTRLRSQSPKHQTGRRDIKTAFGHLILLFSVYNRSYTISLHNKPPPLHQDESHPPRFLVRHGHGCPQRRWMRGRRRMPVPLRRRVALLHLRIRKHNCPLSTLDGTTSSFGSDNRIYQSECKLWQRSPERLYGRLQGRFPFASERRGHPQEV
jgi:hypothetical protein